MKLSARSCVLVVLCCCLIPLVSAATAVANPCAGSGDRAAVCTVNVFGGIDGARLEPIDIDRPITLGIGETLELEFEAYDQFRRRFPDDRLAWGYDADDCDDAVKVDQEDVGRFEMRAAARRGDCRVVVWIPGDLNFEFPLVLRVEGRDASGYGASDAEYVATRLYRGLLGREPDRTGLLATAAEITKGNLESQILAIIQSPEFGSKTDRGDAIAILERLYQGFFGRAVDAAGVAAFQTRIQAGRLPDVVMELLNSEEFESGLVRQGETPRSGRGRRNRGDR